MGWGALTLDRAKGPFTELCVGCGNGWTSGDSPATTILRNDYLSLHGDSTERVIAIAMNRAEKKFGISGKL
jgi:hypothetical protein